MGKENLKEVAQDTIVAQATPAGFGGVGIVRVSGEKTADIAQHMLGLLPKKRVAHVGSFYGENNYVLDHGIALFFKGPNSFTGEDVLELQGHGGPYLIDSLIKRAISLGARQAQPGEFSKRAFLNDKIDLAQAEAVADLIHASSEKAALAAMNTLSGDFSKQIETLVERVVWLRMYVESMIDFSDEDIESLNTNQLDHVFLELAKKLETLLQNTNQGVLLTEGLTVVLCGEPNVGKSSLLNALAKEDLAIVTEIPGTTRDVLSAEIQVNGLRIKLIDTAGLRETTDIVEAKGIQKTLEQAKKADLLLIVREFCEVQVVQLQSHEKQWLQKFSNNTPYFLINNKIDKSNQKPSVIQGEKKSRQKAAVNLSVQTGDGMDLLKEALYNIVVNQNQTEGIYSAKRRHLAALEQAQSDLSTAKNNWLAGVGFELVAEALRGMQNALGEITGKMTSDDLLGKIFSEFCIGK